MLKVKHYQSNEWCKNENARNQEELQKMAKMIRENCKVEGIDDMGSYFCSRYKNENLGIRYWILDEFGHISEITEGREE